MGVVELAAQLAGRGVPNLSVDAVVQKPDYEKNYVNRKPRRAGQPESWQGPPTPAEMQGADNQAVHQFWWQGCFFRNPGAQNITASCLQSAWPLTNLLSWYQPRIYTSKFARAFVKLIPSFAENRQEFAEDAFWAGWPYLCVLTQELFLGHPLAWRKVDGSLPIQDAFANAPWTSWGDAKLSSTLQYLRQSKALRIPQSWRDYLPDLQ